MTLPAFLRPETLYAKTALTLGLAALLFLALTVGTIGYLIVIPVAKRSADDLAALMVISAQTWVELPPATRLDFEQELARNHGLFLVDNDGAPVGSGVTMLPYARFLQESLSLRTGHPVTVRKLQGRDEDSLYWVDIPTGGHVVRFGFTLERSGPQPPLAAALVFTGAIALILFTTLIHVRRLIRPLTELSAAARQLGAGGAPAPLPETGPSELVTLARTFNRMTLQVHDLLADRTAMLSGIAHDLRTPLARLRLTLEMLHDHAADPQLVAEAMQDIEDINHLVGQYLQLGEELACSSPETIDVRDIIDRCVIDARRTAGAVMIEWVPDKPCLVTLRQPLALMRILANLLQNAVRHGAGNPVTVEYEVGSPGCLIKVLDRGPGIPESARTAVFRPFYRLETSRGSDTGGSGLGLAIAMQLSRSHNWQLELRPRAGGGTEARIRVPAD